MYNPPRRTPGILRRELIERTCKQVNRRVPILVGITDTAFVESVDLARSAADAGAAAVVLSTPYYFPAGQTELTGYVRNLAAQLPLPLVLAFRRLVSLAGNSWRIAPTSKKLRSAAKLCAGV